LPDAVRMTEIPPHTSPKKLTRSTEDRMVAGVAGGLARHFDLDPVLFRIGFVVLSLFGGGGVIAYLLLALFVPADVPEADTIGRSTKTRVGLIVIVAIVAIVSLPVALPGAIVLSPLIVLVAIGVLVYQAAGGQVDPRVMRASLIAVTVLGAIALGAGAAVAVAFGGGTIVAGLVLAIGAVMIVAAFAGGARWLIAPALLLAIPVAIVSASDIDLHGGVGQREYRPATVADLRSEYRLGVGELRLDLRDVEFPSGTTTIKTHVGIGSTQVVLPDGACLDSNVDIGVGDARVLGRQNDGIDVDAERREDVPAGLPVVRVEADTGVGEVIIRRGDRAFFVSHDETDCGTR
jgi:phage shock protein PspC (stress-responsive transcriptional regulator)